MFCFSVGCQNVKNVLIQSGDMEDELPDIEFEVEIPEIVEELPADLVLLDTDIVRYIAEIPEGAVIFEDATTAFTDPKIVEWFETAAMDLVTACGGGSQRNRAWAYYRGCYFTTREARTEFMSKVPSSWYWSGEEPGDSIFKAFRGIIGIQGKAYFSLSIRIDWDNKENFCVIE